MYHYIDIFQRSLEGVDFIFVFLHILRVCLHVCLRFRKFPASACRSVTYRWVLIIEDTAHMLAHAFDDTLYHRAIFNGFF